MDSEKSQVNHKTKYPAHELSYEPIQGGYAPIEDYAVVGDLNTVALVGRDGSIDFMCFPDFDSPTIFAGLVDCEKGGRFQIVPLLGEARQKRMYLPDTNVLLSRFLSDDGVAELTDFMPISHPGTPQALVRRVEVIRGEIPFRIVFEPKFNYGLSPHKIEHRAGEVLFFPEDKTQPAVRLISQLPLKIVDGAIVSEFKLRSGQRADFVMEQVIESETSRWLSPNAVDVMFDETVEYWRKWAEQSTYRGRWRENVSRSALVLKLLTSRKFGALVAAPTFGLPSEIGGERNWDYRYTWIRDASFTLYALIRLGYTEEMENFMRWLEARCSMLADGGALQIMYGIDGREELEEFYLDHFEGYRGSKPVRVGNAAYSQLQLDIYGEMMDSVYLFDKYGTPISYDFWQVVQRLTNWVCDNWRRKDEGIWEVRGGSREFIHSRMMCWVAIDRACRLARKRSFPAPLDIWLKERDSIYRDIFLNFWDNDKGCFVQSKGSRAVDAATLLMPLIRFISPTDPKWLSTMRVIEKELVEDSLVYRYRGPDAALDGLEGADATFSLCTFWYAECLSRAGEVNRARLAFEKMLGYANSVGLYSEQLSAKGEFLGNFPQAFTHLGLISAAYDINRRLNPKK